jgi:hypothetical protein
VIIVPRHFAGDPSPTQLLLQFLTIAFGNDANGSTVAGVGVISFHHDHAVSALHVGL